MGTEEVQKTIVVFGNLVKASKQDPPTHTQGQILVSFYFLCKIYWLLDLKLE